MAKRKGKSGSKRAMKAMAVSGMGRMPKRSSKR